MVPIRGAGTTWAGEPLKRVRIAPTGGPSRGGQMSGRSRARKRGSPPGCLPRAQRGARARTGCLALSSEASRLTGEIGGFGAERSAPSAALLSGASLGSLCLKAGRGKGWHCAQNGKDFYGAKRAWSPATRVGGGHFAAAPIQ